MALTSWTWAQRERGMYESWPKSGKLVKIIFSFSSLLGRHAPIVPCPQVWCVSTLPSFCKTEVSVTFQAEARLAAKRAARAEARDIRMRELERQQREVRKPPQLLHMAACVQWGGGEGMRKARSHCLRSPLPGQEHRGLVWDTRRYSETVIGKSPFGQSSSRCSLLPQTQGWVSPS